MKFEKGTPAFTPVIITLETQEEVDALLTIINRSAKLFADSASCPLETKFAQPLYNKLRPLGQVQRQHYGA